MRRELGPIHRDVTLGRGLESLDGFGVEVPFDPLSRPT